MDGWLSPEGVFFDAEFLTHNELASNIVEELHLASVIDDLTQQYATGERLLEIIGWMKFKEEYPELVGWEWIEGEPVVLLNGLEFMTREQYDYVQKHSADLDEQQYDMLSEVVNLSK